jgi:ferredoxin
MTADIYRELARHLDSLPGGFPPTESGVELRILRRLFTTEEAELALSLTMIPKGAAAIARQGRVHPDAATPRLEAMARKGLIYSTEQRGRPAKYRANQFVIGIWEFHVNDLDADLIWDMRAYMPALFEEAWKVPQLRTIPVGRSLTVENRVLPYEQAEELVRAQDRFVVAPCICRREHTLVGQGCDKPEEACLVFGTGAEYYERNGLGRVIDLPETLAILNRAEEEGLVLQASNAKKAVNICCCCGCCCQVLKNAKGRPEPARWIPSPFVAAVRRDTCEGCGLCLERCQMEALQLDGETVVLDANHCIGCGLCVTTCPTGSLDLQRKPAAEQPEVPGSMLEAFIKLGRARGTL